MPRRRRLRSLKALTAQVLEELEEISHDPEQSKSKQANAVFARCDIIQTLLSAQSSETRARIKSGRDDDDSPPKKPEQTPNVLSTPSVTESFEDRLFRLTGKREAS